MVNSFAGFSSSLLLEDLSSHAVSFPHDHRLRQQNLVKVGHHIARVVVPGAKAILTCRNEHFPEAERGRALLNAELKASTDRLTGRSPHFEVLKLKPLIKAQIHQVLSFRTNSKTVKQVMSNNQLMDLARRPLMIELILEALPDVSDGKSIDMSRIYLYAMRRKMERDIKEERTFTSLIDKLYFMCELSWEMLSTNQMSLNYQLFPDEIRRLFGPVVQQQKDLDHWRYDMMGQNLLIRNDDGDYSPAHRSFLEFFVAYKIAAELGILATDFISLFQTDQNRLKMSATMSDEYTWSAYFTRELDKTNVVKPMPYLRKFKAEDINNLAETLGKAHLTVTIWKFLQNMLEINKEEVKTKLLSIIQRIRANTSVETRLVSSNIVTLLVHIDPSALRGSDLSEVNLQNLKLKLPNNTLDFHLSYDDLIDLSGVNFKNANLENADFGGVNITLEAANFQFCNLTDAIFPLNQVDSLSFHPSNKQLVTSSYNNIILWDLASRRLQSRKQTDGSWHVKHSPDGRYIVNSTWGGFEVRDALTLELISSHQNSKPVKQSKEKNRWTSAFAFSSKSQLLFVGSNDSTIYIWDFINLQEIGVLVEHTHSIDEISLSLDEKYLVGRSYSDVITWNVVNRSKISERRWKGASLSGIAFHPKKMIIATIIPNELPKSNLNDLVDGNVHILDPFTMETISIFTVAHARSILFSPDGTRLYIGHWDGFVVFDVSSGQQVFNILSDELNLPIYQYQEIAGPSPQKNLVYKI